MNPPQKPQTVCIHISPAARRSIANADPANKRFIPRPAKRVALPSFPNLGMDGASYQEFFQCLYDAAMITGPNGEIIDSNPRASELFQYDKQELSQMSIVDLISGADESMMEAIRQNFETQNSIYIEGYCERKDESLFPVEVIVNKIRHIKAGTYAFFVRDATRRRQAEETLATERNLLRTLIDSLPDYIYVKDINHRYLVDNISHRKLLNVQSEEEVVGRTVYDFFPKPIADEYYSDDQSVVENGMPIIDREQSHTDLSHQIQWVLTSKMPLFDQYGKPVGSVGISRNVTQYKLSQMRLQEAAEKLEKSNRELQEFAYIASHDLQEPLRKIQAFGDRFKAKYADQLNDEGRDYLQRMQNAASRMQTLINNLLMLSRVTTKGQPFEQVDLNQIVSEVISDLEIRIEQTGAQVEVMNLPTLYADVTQMRQLFQNILGNALKFHRPDQKPHIKVHSEVVRDPVLRTEYQDGVICKITIKDNGIGFDPKYAESIFAPFHRLHSREEYEGTGIGLAICRKIVERHGGTIMAEGAPGEGCVFTLNIPYQHAPAGEAEPKVV